MLDAFGQPQSVVVLGGTSDIAGAILDALCARRCRTVVLAGRDRIRLTETAARASASGAERVTEVEFDATDVADAGATVERCFDAAGDVDLVLCAVGQLSRRQDELDPARTGEVVTVSYAWPAAALTRAGVLLAEQGYGRILVLSSVAGVRVRRANFVYGSAKAGLDSFSLGLAEALRGTGVTVQVVRPGFVRTKMTAGLDAAPLAMTPEVVATAVVFALGRAKPVVWVPPVLRLGFAILGHLPTAIWRRLPE